MRLGWAVLAAGMGFAQGAWAEDVVLELKPIKNAQECRSALESFAWACTNFDDPGWRDYNLRLFGENKGYWDRYSAAATLVDLDGDGNLDLILQMLSSMTCGMRNCDTHLLFAGVSTQLSLVSHKISGPYRPATLLLGYEGGEPEIRFETGSMWFNVSAMKLEMREIWTWESER